MVFLHYKCKNNTETMHYCYSQHTMMIYYRCICLELYTDLAAMVGELQNNVQIEFKGLWSLEVRLILLCTL